MHFRASWLLLACSALAPAQQPVSKPSFEVASIKPSDPNPANSILVGMKADPAIVRYGNLNLRDAIRGAYMVRAFQIEAPEWTRNARFEVEAKMPEGATAEQIPLMFQSLLEERFKLKLRREMREMSVYALVAAPGGHKLKPTEMKIDEKTPTAMGTDGKPRPLVSFGGNSAAVTVTAPGADLLAFVGVTSRFTAKPIVDATGIPGRFDFQITFAPEVRDILAEAPPDVAAGLPQAPVLADALKAYGLRLESRKMPIEILIVEHLEKLPTEN